MSELPPGWVMSTVGQSGRSSSADSAHRSTITATECAHTSVLPTYFEGRIDID